MRSIGYTLLLVMLVGCAREARMGRKVHRVFEQNPIFQQAFSGLVVKDALSGKIITNINGNKLFTPASNTKMVTLMTALAYLPDTLPSLVYEVHGDSLLFWGMGNPAFLDERITWDSVTYRFLAQAKQSLYFCSDNFNTTGLGAGWAWDDRPYRYSAMRTPMPIYQNSIHIAYDSIHQEVTVIPSLFRENVSYTSSIGRIHYQKKNNSIHLAGNSPARYDRGVPFDYSDSLLSMLLADTLHRQVIAESVCGLPSSEAVTLNTVMADSVYAIMMQQSDNLMAEQLLLMSAYAKTGILSEDSILPYAQKELLEPLRIKPRWVDGSGLSRYNKFSPMQLVSVLDYLLKTQPESRLQSIFPQGEIKGTIKNWYPSYVFAKTGTMSGVHSLTGFMTTHKGRKVIFSFMNNNYLGSSRQYKPEMRKILELIWAKY